MRYRSLGATGLQVSAVSLGSWLTFGGSVDEDTSIRCIHRAFDLGVSFFDTANVYAMGRAEEVVGRALASFPRDGYLVGTKVFFPMAPGPDDRGLGRKHVLEQCDASLRRLGLGHIDLYQCHRYDPDTPLEETCRAMDDLVSAGKILCWGVSEWTAAQMEGAVALCRREGLQHPETDQPRYSLLERGAEAEVLPTCRRLGLGVVVFSPLGQGVLTGKYRSVRDAPPDSRAADPEGGMFIGRLLTKENLARVDRLRPIAADVGITVGQLALAWVLSRADVSSAIVGATKPEHVEENVRASEATLDPDVLDRIERAVA